MKKIREMTGHEKIAYRNIKGIFEWEVGGWYNCIQDGYEDDIPDTKEEAMNIIYEGSLTDMSRPGFYAIGCAPSEMRFAGTKFIKDCIAYLFSKDEDIAEIAEVKNW